MKKLVLAIGLGAYFVFSASALSLAALRADTAAGIAAIRDSRIAWAVTGTNARLLFLNEALYPEAAADSAVTDDTSTTFTDSQLVYRQGERSGAAQADTTSTDTQRLFCDGDICLVP